MQICKERVHWLVGFLLSLAELCTLEDHVSFFGKMLIVFLLYLAVFLLLSLCKSEGLKNIVRLVTHAVNHCVYLLNFVLLVELGRYAIPLKSP